MLKSSIRGLWARAQASSLWERAIVLEDSERERVIQESMLMQCVLQVIVVPNFILQNLQHCLLQVCVFPISKTKGL